MVKKFNKELAKIRQNALDKKKAVTGWFKGRQIYEIERDEDNKISDFLLAQQCAIEEQEELVQKNARNCSFS